MMKKRIALGLLGATFCPSVVSGQAVDVHSHIVVPEYVETLKAHDAELEETFPVPHWDVNRHIAFMDSTGISTAVLTMPASQPYFGDTEESAACIRRVNEAAAKAQSWPLQRWRRSIC